MLKTILRRSGRAQERDNSALATMECAEYHGKSIVFLTNKAVVFEAFSINF